MVGVDCARSTGSTRRRTLRSSFPSLIDSFHLPKSGSTVYARTLSFVVLILARGAELANAALRCICIVSTHVTFLTIHPWLCCPPLHLSIVLAAAAAAAAIAAAAVWQQQRWIPEHIERAVAGTTCFALPSTSIVLPPSRWAVVAHHARRNSLCTTQYSRVVGIPTLRALHTTTQAIFTLVASSATQ